MADGGCAPHRESLAGQSPGAELPRHHQGNESLPARAPAYAFPVSETFSSDSDQYPESNRPAKPQGLVHCTVSSLSRPPTSPFFSSFFGRETDETFFSELNRVAVKGASNHFGADCA